MKTAVALAILPCSPGMRASTSSVDARVLPARPYVEIRDGGKILNFDLMLHNTGDTPLRLVAIREAVYDGHGTLEREREVNANGSPSALAGLGDLVLQPGAYKDVFEPFERYDADTDLSRLHVILVFMKPGRAEPPGALDGDAVTELDDRGPSGRRLQVPDASLDRERQFPGRHRRHPSGQLCRKGLSLACLFRHGQQ